MHTSLKRFLPFLALASVLLFSGGCETPGLQTSMPPMNRGAVPDGAVPAVLYDEDVMVTYAPMSKRPNFGWLLVDRYPGDAKPSVVPAWPYTAYMKIHGVVTMVYSTQRIGTGRVE